jgi:hypothetical protein
MSTQIQIASSGGGTDLSKILFVDPNGNDLTGEKGNLSKPYLTLEAAKTAALAGDLIYVFPGIYTVTTTGAEGLAKDGVRYYFSPEAIVNKSTTGPIFYANGFLYGFNVYGYGNFNKTTNIGPIFATNNILVYGSVTTFGSLVGGTGYTTGLKATTGGTGTGLIVNVTSVGGTGNITALTISNAGQTYKVGDVITITGGTTPATITVTAITPNYNSDADISFEANDLFMSAADFALSFNSTARVNLKFNNLLSTTTSVYLGSSNITIDMYSIVSTAGYAFSGSGGNQYFQSCNLLVSGYLIHATSTAVNIYTMLIGIGNNCTFNVNNILTNSSNGTAIISNGYNNTLSLNVGYITSINGTYGSASYDVYLNGTCGVISGQLNLFGGQVIQINGISAGVIDTTYSGTRANAGGLTISISGGNVTLNMRDQDSTTGFNISGGVVTLNGTWTNDDLSSDAVLTGGTLILNGDYEWGGPIYTSSRAYGINVTGGKLIVNGTIRINYPETTTARSLNASPIQYGSGKVIINGGVLISNIPNATPIRATSAGLSLRVYSGGMNTNLIANGGTLAAKKMKVRFTVNAVAATSITLNDGTGGNEGFTESNTAVYNTTALLAQRMVTLINASATLDITASQDTPGTDAYFYAEADVANAGYTVVTYANLTELGLVPGMFALTQSVLGTIIEDTDVE